MTDGHGTKLYLHIGRHKCGTSTLQHFLCDSTGALAAHGFIYPEALRAPVAHHPVARFYNPNLTPMGGDGDAGASIQAFWQALRTGQTGIVSSEAFQNLDPQRLKADLVPFDLTIIIYLREPLDYLLSAYAQRVKGGGGTETLDVFAARFRPDYRQFLSGWRAAFPAADMKVRVFERGRLVGRDIRRDFLHCLGLDEQAAEAFRYPDTDSNVSIGGPLLEFMRRVNLRGRPDGNLGGALYRACQDLAVRHADYRQRPPLPAALQQEVRDRHREALAWVADTYFAGAPAFRERAFPVGEIDHGLAREAHDLVWQRLEDVAPEVAVALAKRIVDEGPLYDA